jgi:hypothetical protein
LLVKRKLFAVSTVSDYVSIAGRMSVIGATATAVASHLLVPLAPSNAGFFDEKAA